jgi:hypothetical protein
MKATDGYAAARRLLKEMFGNNYTITQAWIDKMISSQSLLQIIQKLPRYLQTRWLTKVHQIKTEEST